MVRKISAILIEVIVIGAFSALLQFLIYKALTGAFPNPKLEHYNKMILGGFLLGASIHIIFEVIGANEAWCKQTYFLK